MKKILLSFLSLCIAKCIAFDVSDIQRHAKINPTLAKKIYSWIKNREKEENYGWNGAYEHFIPFMSKKYNLEIGCEIGVASGGHSYKILKNSNLKCLYSVDPYIKHNDPSNPHYSEVTQLYLDMMFLNVKNKLSEFKNRSVLLRSFSVEAAKTFKDSSLDFIFLDASHVYEQVKADLEAWDSKVRKGGMLSGDDFSRTGHPGVAKAVTEFCKKNNLKYFLDKKHPRVWYAFKI